MSRSSKLNLGAALGAFALVTAMVLQLSSAAFTGSTSNSGNSFGAGTVSLSDDAVSALFSLTNLVPLDSNVSCIEVSYDGSVTPGSAITLAASVVDTTVAGDGLGDDLDMTVEMGILGSTCSSFTLGSTVFSGTLDGLGTAQSTWSPVLGTDTMRPFRITSVLGADTLNDAQGESADVTFTWTASS